MLSEIFVGSRKIKPTDKPRVHSFPAGALRVGERPSKIRKIGVSGWVGRFLGQVSGTLVQR